MRNKKILNDPEIKKISMENIGAIDMETINQIDGFGGNKKGTGGVVAAIIVLVLACALITTVIYTSVNYKIVEGDVIGSEFQIGEWSFVDSSYSPYAYLKEGVTIYYDGNDGFINNASDFSVAVISKANSGKYYIENGFKDTLIKQEQIKYALRTSSDSETEQE
jgi:hypothetical protein